MKYFIPLLFSLFSSVVVAQQWQTMQDFPGVARDDGSVFKIGQKVYCGLGMNPWFGYNNDFHVFNLDSENWEIGESMPTAAARQYANGFSHNDLGYIFGGINSEGEFLNDLWKFNPQNNEWTLLPNLPALGRAGSVSFIIADTAYIVGGKTISNEILTEVWAFDFSAQIWSQKADFTAGIWRGVAFSSNEKGIVGLGKTTQSDLSATFKQYSPELNTWTNISLTLPPKSYTSATQIDSLAFLYGGMNENGDFSNDFIKINLETLEVFNLTSFPSDARRGSLAFAGNDEFYLTTGVSVNGRLDETWKAGYILKNHEISVNDSKISILPNPTQGAFTLTSDKNIEKITIFTLSGNQVFEQKIENESITINPLLAQGIYLVKASGENTSNVIRLVIQ